MVTLWDDDEMQSHPESCGDREYVLSNLSSPFVFGDNLRYAALELRGDREIVLAAARARPRMPILQFAAPELHGDPEIVLEAVKRNPDNFRYATPELCGDRHIVLEAIRNHRDMNYSLWGTLLRYVSPELHGDREIVMEAVRVNTDNFRYATPELRGDRHIVLEVIRNYRPPLETLLRYVSPELHGDREIVLEVVRHDGEAFERLGQNGGGVFFIPENLKKRFEQWQSAMSEKAEAVRIGVTAWYDMYRVEGMDSWSMHGKRLAEDQEALSLSGQGKNIFVFLDNTHGKLDEKCLSFLHFCIASIDICKPRDTSLHIVSMATLKRYVNPAQHFESFDQICTSTPVTFLKDLITMMLVWEHGGIFVDAGTLLMGPTFLDIVFQLLDDEVCDFLAFDSSDVMAYVGAYKFPGVDMWFGAARKHSWFVKQFLENAACVRLRDTTECAGPRKLFPIYGSFMMDQLFGHREQKPYPPKSVKWKDLELYQHVFCDPDFHVGCAFDKFSFKQNSGVDLLEFVSQNGEKVLLIRPGTEDSPFNHARLDLLSTGSRFDRHLPFFKFSSCGSWYNNSFYNFHSLPRLMHLLSEPLELTTYTASLLVYMMMEK